MINCYSDDLLILLIIRDLIIDCPIVYRSSIRRSVNCFIEDQSIFYHRQKVISSTDNCFIDNRWIILPTIDYFIDNRSIILPTLDCFTDNRFYLTQLFYSPSRSFDCFMDNEMFYRHSSVSSTINCFIDCKVDYNRQSIDCFIDN